MDEKYLILSDIHGNLSAFDAVMNDCEEDSFSGIILLGDLIDYGMRSNEVIQRIKEYEASIWKDKIVVNIWGNHEKLLIDKDLERLSSDRGRTIAEYTANHVSSETVDYINNMNTDGIDEFLINGIKCLAVHGSINDNYWKSIQPDNLNGDYVDYDIVFSGHSHFSHMFTHFYDVDNPGFRNKKSVMFINPGSVGQPRNHNKYAQYAILSLPSKRVDLRAVEYDIEYEQSLYPEEVDEFYKTRISKGI